MDFRQTYDSRKGNPLHQKVSRRRPFYGPREQQEHHDRWYGDNTFRPSDPEEKDLFGDEEHLKLVKTTRPQKPPPEES